MEARVARDKASLCPRGQEIELSPEAGFCSVPGDKTLRCCPQGQESALSPGTGLCAALAEPTVVFANSPLRPEMYQLADTMSLTPSTSKHPDFSHERVLTSTFFDLLRSVVFDRHASQKICCKRGALSQGSQESRTLAWRVTRVHDHRRTRRTLPFDDGEVSN